MDPDRQAGGKGHRALVIWLVIVALSALAVLSYMNPAALRAIGAMITKAISQVNWQQLLQATTVGILASLAAAVLYTLTEKRRVRQLHEAVITIAKRLEASEEDRDRILARFPDAIGGPFTQSVLGFPPVTSAMIAKILSDETAAMYKRYHSKVIVVEAADTYRIQSLRPILIDGEETRVWELQFHIMWRWRNDSQVRKYPLRDFVILVVPPEWAVGEFFVGGAEEKKEQREERGRFLDERENFVRSIVVNPLDATKRVNRSESVDALFEVKEVQVKIAGHGVATISEIELEPLIEQGELIKRGIYLGYRLPRVIVRSGKGETITEWPLEKGGECVVEYTGRMCIPIDYTGRTVNGWLDFPPSDLVAERYSLTLVYPVDSGVVPGCESVAVIERESGCQRLHGLLGDPPMKHDRPHDLPTSFVPGKGQRADHIVVRGPLTDIHRIVIGWSNDSEDGVPATPIGDRAQSAV